MRRIKSTTILLFLFFLSGCSGGVPEEAAIPGQEKPAAMETDHSLYKHFIAVYGEKKPLLTGVNDINDDGREDLIVIYQDTAETNKMIAIWEEKRRGDLFRTYSCPGRELPYRMAGYR